MHIYIPESFSLQEKRRDWIELNHSALFILENNATKFIKDQSETAQLQREGGNVIIIAGKNFSWKVSIIFQGISKVCDLGGILPTWVIKLARDLGGIRFHPHQPQITAAPPLKPFGMPIVFNVMIMMRWDFQKIDFYKTKYWKAKNKCFWFNVAQKIKIHRTVCNAHP